MGVFGVPFTGNVATFALGAALFLLVTLGMGVLISTVSQNQGQAIQLAFMIMLPQVLLSGLIFPVSSMARGRAVDLLRAAADLFHPGQQGRDAEGDADLRALGSRSGCWPCSRSWCWAWRSSGSAATWRRAAAAAAGTRSRATAAARRWPRDLGPGERAGHPAAGTSLSTA